MRPPARHTTYQRAMSKDSIMSYGLVVEQRHVKQGLTDRLRTVENYWDHSWLISTVGATPLATPTLSLLLQMRPFVQRGSR